MKPGYVEYNLWNDDGNIDEWIPSALVAVAVYRSFPKEEGVQITGYRTSEGKDFVRLTEERLWNIAKAELDEMGVKYGEK